MKRGAKKQGGHALRPAGWDWKEDFARRFGFHPMQHKVLIQPAQPEPPPPVKKRRRRRKKVVVVAAPKPKPVSPPIEHPVVVRFLPEVEISDAQKICRDFKDKGVGITKLAALHKRRYSDIVSILEAAGLLEPIAISPVQK